ncbi:MAG: Ppx/GppA phosphatase family protein [Eubacteriales bacterium]
MEIKTYAVVDFGTNSARLMLAKVQNGAIISTKKQLKTIRLGEKMTEGRITDAAMQRASDALTEFLVIAQNENAIKFYAFATSAVREAENTQDFLSHIKENCNVDVDVITGDSEADIGFLGASSGKSGRLGLIDIGGGSTEVVIGENGKIEYAKSFKVGTVRLLQMFPDASPEDQNEYRACQQHILSVFADLPKDICPDVWLGIGGTGTALAAIDQRLKVYDPDKVDGYAMAQSRLNALAKQLRGMTLAERKALTGLDDKRADVIVYGALLMQTFTEQVGANGYTACESDNLEGYLLKKIRP